MAKAEKDIILKELFSIEDYNEKFKYIIQKGKAQLPLSEEFKVDTYQIEGCLSKLWLHPTFKEGKIYLNSDSDAAIPKGIAAILTEIYSGSTPDEALAIDPIFLKEAGVDQHLSMNRRNGLSKLCNQIRMYALVFKQMESKPK